MQHFASVSCSRTKTTVTQQQALWFKRNMGFLANFLADNPFIPWSMRISCNGNFSPASTLQLSFILIHGTFLLIDGGKVQRRG